MRGRGSFRGSQRGRVRDRNVSQSAGPLMTNHLRDIDIEMEILKRKRDMIQQEHELLDREREFNLKRQYEQQASMSYSQPSSRGGYSSNFYRQQGNKRQAVEMSPPRRYDPPPRIEPWQQNVSEPPKFLPRSRNYQNNPRPPPPPAPQPLLSIDIDKQYRAQNTKPQVRKEFKTAPKKSFPPRKDFNPTKITKAKARTTFLDKPVAAPVNKKKNEKAKKLSVEELTLRPDVIPCVQVNGRLELALGSILKDIKQNDLETSSPAVALSINKLIKKIIRDRIRSIMMNKVVGHVPDIVDLYRNKYPKETDIELVNLGKKAQALHLTSLDEQNLDTDDPQEYLKKNFNRLVSSKLDEMFELVTKIYTEKSSNVDLSDHMDKVEQIKNSETNDTNGVEMQPSEDTIQITDKIEKLEVYRKLMDALLVERLPKILPKYKMNLIALLDSNKEYHHGKSRIEDESIKMACQLVLKKFEKEQTEKSDVIIVEDSSNVIDISDDKPIEVESKVEPSAVDVENNKDAVTKAVEDKKTDDCEKQGVAQKTPAQTPKTPVSKIIDYAYFVKLIGRPELPSRQAVYDFLEQFKPDSIKKHKTVNNLLVLGFNNKDAYDKILEASETSIGTNTLIIKASEKATPQSTPQKTTPAKNSGVDKASKSPTADGDQSKDSDDKSLSIGSDLDEQITNLLTKIKQAEDSISLNETETNKSNGDDENKDANAGPENKNDESDRNDEDKTGVNGDGNDIAKDSMETIAEVDEESNNKNVNSENEVSADKESNEGSQKNGSADEKTEKVEDKDPKSALKESGRATPTRASSRLASVTPSTIKTRRASRLAQNN